jgi:hypothetical protein
VSKTRQVQALFLGKGAQLDVGILTAAPGFEVGQSLTVVSVLGIVESLLKHTAGKARTQSTMLHAFLDRTPGNKAFTPEHLAIRSLAARAIHRFSPLAVAAVGAAPCHHPSIHTEILSFIRPEILGYCFLKETTAHFSL